MISWEYFQTSHTSISVFSKYIFIDYLRLIYVLEGCFILPKMTKYWSYSTSVSLSCIMQNMYNRNVSRTNLKSFFILICFILYFIPAFFTLILRSNVSFSQSAEFEFTKRMRRSKKSPKIMNLWSLSFDPLYLEFLKVSQV